MLPEAHRGLTTAGHVTNNIFILFYKILGVQLLSFFNKNCPALDCLLLPPSPPLWGVDSLVLPPPPPRVGGDHNRFLYRILDMESRLGAPHTHTHSSHMITLSSDWGCPIPVYIYIYTVLSPRIRIKANRLTAQRQFPFWTWKRWNFSWSIEENAQLLFCIMMKKALYLEKLLWLFRYGIIIGGPHCRWYDLPIIMEIRHKWWDGAQKP